MKHFYWLLMLLAAAPLRAGEGDSVVIVYNTRVPESKEIAEHYAERRAVPRAQIFGFALTTNEVMSRTEFREQLQEPLLQSLEARRLFDFHSVTLPASESKPAQTLRALLGASVRYVVLCYGVPLKIAHDDSANPPGADKQLAGLRNNGAAVDSELALLPISPQKYALAGLRRNPLYGSTNAAALHPTNGVFLVTRLDGPTPQIARALVDKALEAETNGWWGRAYFDARGLSDGAYKMGDEWIQGAAKFARRFGFETVLDEKPETFSTAFPLSQIALYAGWYDNGVSGPFALPKVEFMPGAIAYHLHSFSAQSIRSANGNWVGPLLAKGATATMGCVDEPFLAFTPDIMAFCGRIFNGWSFGEAAYAAQSALSWQTTVVGDPLYRPVYRRPQAAHEDLLKRKSPLIEWSYLRVVTLGQNQGSTAMESAAYLEQIAETKTSAVLLEKLGDLYFAQGKPATAAATYERALQQNPTAQQKVRLLLTLAERLEGAQHPDEAAEIYRRLLKEAPDYPDAPGVRRLLEKLAEKNLPKK